MVKYVNEKEFENEIIKKQGVYLVDFYATWCGPCQMIAPILEEISNSRAGYNIYKIDVDNNKELASKLNIDTIPTICIYKDGKLVDKQVGYKDKKQIIELIEKYN